jgi:hypothetical protein
MALSEEMALAVEFALKTISSCCKFPPQVNGDTIGHWGRLLTDAGFTPDDVRSMGDKVAMNWREAPSLNEFATALHASKWQMRISMPVHYCWDGKDIRLGWGEPDNKTTFVTEEEALATVSVLPVKYRKREPSARAKEGGKKLLDSILSDE